MPAAPAELIRFRVDLGQLQLNTTANVTADLRAFSPGASPVNGRVEVSNGRLFGSIVFGLDTSDNPFYLLTAPDAIRPDAITQVGAGFVLTANYPISLCSTVRCRWIKPRRHCPPI